MAAKTVQVQTQVRLKPSQAHERGSGDVVTVAGGNRVSVSGGAASAAAKHYTFDFVHQAGDTNDRVYQAMKELSAYAFDGFNTAILVYGQRNSGKSHTLWGSSTDENGIMKSFACDIFAKMAMRREMSFFFFNFRLRS